jgi:ribosomal protein S18 acetylase RimI-like enzyme
LPVVLEPSWVGRRVSVRRVVEREADGRLRQSDVVGELAGLDAQTAVIESRAGLVEVPIALVTAARLATPSTADELALETVIAEGLRPLETHALGGWVLRADHGFTRRANSALPLRQAGLPLDEMLGRAHGWYARRGLPLKIQVPTEARRLLDAELGERGWAAEGLTQVLAGRLDTLHAAPAAPLPVEITGRPDDDWLGLYRSGAALEEPARELLTRHPHAGFAAVRVEGRTAAVARGTLDQNWLGITAVEVAPEHRRAGLATAVTAALWDWGRAQGATRSYVTVLADNAPAVALYEKLGYWVHHEYHYRLEP